MTPLERVCEAYCNAFRDGFMRVGGGKDYPLWSQYHPETKAETMRCMRHAMEEIRDEYMAPDGASLSFDELFPEPLAKRSTKRTQADAEMAKRLKG